MESNIIHQQLNDPSDSEARDALVCYLQYLMDYHRDVPTVEDHIINELQRLRSTKYAKQLPEEDPVCSIMRSSEDLDAGEYEANKPVWRMLRNSIINLA